MTTTSFIYLLIGIAIGWLIELIIDYFFWRSRRNCSETERQLRYKVHDLERSNAVLAGRLEAAERTTTLGTVGQETAGLVEVIQALATNRGAMTVNVNSDSESTGRSQPGTPNGGSRSGSSSIETLTEINELSRRDNLSVIWGIGPKTETALKEKGIFTFRQLADTSITTLRELFEGTTGRGALLNDDDFLEWQAQAALAADGKIEQLAQRKLAYSQKMRSRSTRNLEHIWGIGKKVETELYGLGINSLRDLANAKFEQIESVLQKIKGDYGSDDLNQVYEWVVIQAKLAANGFWGRLDGFQEQFRGEGHRDDFTQIDLISEDIQKALSVEYYIHTWEQLAEIDLDAVTQLKKSYFSQDINLSDLELLDRLQSAAREQKKVTTRTSTTETYSQ